MKIAVASSGNTLDAPVDPRFGRCPWFLVVDSDTMQFRAIANPAVSAAGGAGIQAAQTIAREGAQALIAGNVGPNAFQVLSAAGIQVVASAGGTVREAVEAYTRGQLGTVSAPTVAAHAGMAAPPTPGAGSGPTGMGQGLGMGRGAGRMGRGGGGMGRGRGGGRLRGG
jgi:predicted Fe-Mo cluster-binding NifX family protein